MKKFIAVILCVLMAICAVTVVCADDSVFTADTETRGDWVGKYGAEGYFIPGPSESQSLRNLPDYADVSVTDLSGRELTTWWVFWDESETKRCPYDALGALWADKEKSYRRAACQFDQAGLDISIDIGENVRKVSLYLTDFDASPEKIRSCEVILYDEDFHELAFTEVYDYAGGIYISAAVTGRVTFEIARIGGPNVVYSGIFFDDAGDVLPAVYEEPAEAETGEQSEIETAETFAETEPTDESETDESSDDKKAVQEIGELAAFGILLLPAGAAALLIFKRKEV